MLLEQILILQFIAHLLTDYTFQSNEKAEEKNIIGFKSKFLKWHIFLAFIFSWVLSFQLNFIFGALVIALSHWLVDGFKIFLNKNHKLGKYAFFIDQVIHLTIILIVVLLHDKYLEIKPVMEFSVSTKTLGIITAYLFCTKPANVLIKEIFHVYEISIDKSTIAENNELPNAGKLIGIIERWMVLVFIILNQYGAMGFLIAAKSILRYKDNDGLKAEYVLIGTLLSFSIAIGLGVLILML